MQSILMTASFLTSVVFGVFLWSYVEQKPIVLMMEDNMHREADCVYIPVPGVRCEPGF